MGKKQMEKIQRLKEELSNCKQKNKQLREEVNTLRTKVKGTLDELLGELSDQMDEVNEQSKQTQSAAVSAENAAERAKMSSQAIVARTAFLAFAVVGTALWAYTVDWTSMSGVADLPRVLRTGSPDRGPLTFAAWGAYGLFEVVHRYIT